VIKKKKKSKSSFKVHEHLKLDTQKICLFGHEHFKVP